jgi:hypothetical protein
VALSSPAHYSEMSNCTGDNMDKLDADQKHLQILILLQELVLGMAHQVRRTMPVRVAGGVA